MFAPDERQTELAILFFTAIASRNDDKSPLVQNRILATKVESTVDPRKAITYVSPIKLMRAARFCQKLSSDLAMFANSSVTIPG